MIANYLCGHSVEAMTLREVERATKLKCPACRRQERQELDRRQGHAHECFGCSDSRPVLTGCKVALEHECPVRVLCERCKELDRQGRQQAIQSGAKESGQ